MMVPNNRYPGGMLTTPISPNTRPTTPLTHQFERSSTANTEFFAIFNFTDKLSFAGGMIAKLGGRIRDFT
ncbi:hypothetical protein GCM10007205_07870 [Oxalicibacterium flavum]|uniref:Uncharacterized protein n=1 Tax=Oxalicibacterium flavum TaxID=179467 RepID=A0A8J2UPD7_9BURK|nr:hypothetical protein GCM10007205_07870 [Oxalicibacterium flavum]